MNTDRKLTQFITGGAFAIVLVFLVLAAGCGDVFGQNADPAAPHEELLYGRVTTYNGEIYEGRLRFGGDEEAFWGHYFNGFKDENPWAAQVGAEHLTEERFRTEIFGFEILIGERPIELGRPFLARFGDIAHIEARGNSVRMTLESGIENDFAEFLTQQGAIE